jgi:hyaluronan synthase
VGWLLLGRGIRGYSHLRQHPGEILLLPLVALVVVFIALPVKLYALFTMNKQGWLTRHADLIGGEGQSSASVRQEPAMSYASLSNFSLSPPLDVGRVAPNHAEVA